MVALVAGVLPELARRDSARRLVGGHGRRRGPGPLEDLRVIEGERVVDRLGAHPGEPLDEPQGGARLAPRGAPVGVGLVDEVDGLDHEGVALPPAPRLARPLRDAGQGPVVQGDDPQLVVHLVQHHHLPRRLQDLQVHVVGLQRHHVGEPVGDAALAGVGVGVGVERADAVARPLAVVGLALAGQPGDAAVGRVDDQRRAAAAGDARPRVQPHLVVAADGARRRLAVVRGPALHRPLLYRGRLLVGQQLAPGLTGRPLQRRQGGGGPNPLQVRVAPRRPRELPTVIGPGLSARHHRLRHQQRPRRNHRRQPSPSVVHRPSPSPARPAARGKSPAAFDLRRLRRTPWFRGAALLRPSHPRADPPLHALSQPACFGAPMRRRARRNARCRRSGPAPHRHLPRRQRLPVQSARSGAGEDTGPGHRRITAPRARRPPRSRGCARPGSGSRPRWRRDGSPGAPGPRPTGTPPPTPRPRPPRSSRPRR